MNSTRYPPEPSAVLRRRRYRYHRFGLVILLLLNGVMAARVWPDQPSTSVTGCLAARYLPGREVRVCTQPVNSNAMQTPEYFPQYQLSSADTIRIHAWDLDLRGRIPRLLVTIHAPRSLLLAFPLSVGLVLVSLLVLLRRSRWR